MLRNISESHILKKIAFTNEKKSYSASLVVSSFNSNEFEAIHIMRHEEKLQLQEYNYKKRKESYYYGRVSGKIAVSNFLNLNFQDFYIDKGIFSQPVVCCLTKGTCQVSISHAEKASVAIAFDERHPMGIDIEVANSKNSESVFEHLSSNEKELCTAKNTPLIVWTAKEALSKALKIGLTIPLPLLEIKTFAVVDDVYCITFKNFQQYRVASFLLENNILSIAYPSTSTVNTSAIKTSNFQAINLEPFSYGVL